MADQLQPKPASSQFSSIPGYRTNEPVGSAWNRSILSRYQTGQGEQLRQEQIQREQQASKPSQALTSMPAKSTSPEMEAAILSSYEKNPEAFGYLGKSGGYLSGLVKSGVLTSSDVDTLNAILGRYNAQITKTNKEIREQNYQSSKQMLADLTSNLQQAKNSGINNIDVLDAKGNKIGSINPQNVAEARLQFLNLTQKGATQISYSTQTSSINKTELNDVVNRSINEAKSAGAKSIQIFDAQTNKVIDTIPIKSANTILGLAVQNQILAGRQISLGYSGIAKVSPKFTGPTLGSNPAELAKFQDPFTQFIRSSNIQVQNAANQLGSLLGFITSGGKTNSIPKEHEAQFDVFSRALIPTKEAVAQAGGLKQYYTNIAKTISENPYSVAGAALPTIETFLIPGGEIATGTKSLVNIGKAAAEKIPLKYAQSIPVYKFITKNLPAVTEKVTASDLLAIEKTRVTKLQSIISNVDVLIRGITKTTKEEKTLGTSLETPKSLSKQYAGLSSFRNALAGQLEQRKEIVSTLTKISERNPTKTFGTKATSPVFTNIEKLGSNVYLGTISKEESPFAGAIITLGKKEAGTITPILKEIPTGLKTPSSFELMQGVSKEVQTFLEKNPLLQGPEKAEKVQNVIAKYLKGKNEEFEITRPKEEGSEAIFGTTTKTSEEAESFAKAFVPKPVTYGLGKELTFGTIKEIQTESPGILSKEFLGFLKPNVIEKAKTGEIQFARTPFKNFVKDINRLKKPIKSNEELSGSRSAKYQKIERPRGFTYLSSRFKPGKYNINPTRFIKNRKGASPIKIIGSKFEMQKGFKQRYPSMTEAPKIKPEEYEKNVIKNIFAEKELTKPLSKEESRVMLKNIAKQYMEKEKGSEANKILELTAKSTLAARKQTMPKIETSYETIAYPKTERLPSLLTKNEFVTTTKAGLAREIKIKPIQEIKLGILQKQALNQSTFSKLEQTSKEKLSTTPITTTSQITKTFESTVIKTEPIQSFKLTQQYKYEIPTPFPTGNTFEFNPPKEGGGGEFPPFFPDKKRTLGGIDRVFGGGKKKSYIGNVPEFNFTGLYNRSETIYGRVKNPKQKIKKSKPLSNKFTKLI